MPADNRLGAEGEGFTLAMRVLDRGRLHISAVCVGVAERLIADQVAYADRAEAVRPGGLGLPDGAGDDRRQQGRGAGRPRAGTLETARLRDSGANTTLEAASAKLFASEMVGRVADRTVQIFGGAGYIAEYGIERLYRDVRLFRIYEGSSADPEAGDRARDPEARRLT